MCVVKSLVPVLVFIVLFTSSCRGNLLSDSTPNEVEPVKSLLLKPVPKSLVSVLSGKGMGDVGTPLRRDVAAELAEMAEALFFPAEEESVDAVEGRRRKHKHGRHELMIFTKMLMGLKIALLGIVLPLGVFSAQILSWKAVTLSLLAYMLAKIVFVKNLFMTKTTPAPTITQAPPPLAPIIIQGGSPGHDSVWKRNVQPKIHLQPEVHVHQAKEEHPTPSWTWAEEGRVAKDAHVLAFGKWAPQLTTPTNDYLKK